MGISRTKPITPSSHFVSAGSAQVQLTRIPTRRGLLWAAAAVLSFSAFTLHFGPGLSNDSYQYLSVAENISRTGRIETSIVHFDEERRHGSVPAPQTTFPPGYPAMISAIARLGVAPEAAGTAISLGSVVALTLLLWKLCEALGCGAAATQLCLLLWLTSAYAIHFSRSISTEALFTAIVTGSILLLLKGDAAITENGTVVASTYWAFLLAGLSAWVRYAGLVIIAGYFVYAFAVLLRRGVRRKSLLVASLGTLCGAAFVLVARNWVITKTLQGSNTKPVWNPFLPTLRTGVEAIPKVVFSAEAAGNLLFVVIALAALLFLGVLAWKRRMSSQAVRPVLVTGWVVAVYSAIMFYAALHTVITFGSRYFVPILPAVLAMIAWIIGTAWTPASTKMSRRAAVVTAAVVFFGCYFIANTRSLLAPSRPDPAAEVRRRLAVPDDSGMPLRAWIDAHIAPMDVVFATEGQATGYVLHRPVVAAIEHDLSTADWTEAEVHRVMTTHRATYLMVYPGASPQAAPSQMESQFLAGLTQGIHPDWLVIAARNPYVMIYRRVQ